MPNEKDMDIKETLGRLRDIKESLYDSSNIFTTDNDLYKIVKLKDVSDEVYETLILLHSKYKAETQLMKSTQHRVLNDLIDVQMDILRDMRHILNDDEPVKTSILDKPYMLIFIPIIGLTFIGGVFYLFTKDHTAGGLIVELFKAMFSGGSK